MNHWLLKARLAEALSAHGPGTFWIETREKPRVDEIATA